MKLTGTKRTAGRVAGAVLLSLIALPSAAGSYSEIARTLSRAAARGGVRRIAVRPLIPLGGASQAEGRRIAESLTNALVRRGRTAVVERTLLPELMQEHLLARTGFLDPREAARLGGAHPADAVVAGTFVTLGSKVRIEVRLIDLEKGLVLAASTARLKREFFPELAAAIPEPAPITGDMAVAEVYEDRTGLPYYASSAPPLRRSARGDDLRDSVAEIDCSRYSERIDRLQEGVLALKARYWAAKLKDPAFDASKVGLKPNALMSDPGLRRRFRAAIKGALADKETGFTLIEIRKFTEADRRSFELSAACGGPGRQP